MATSRQLRCDPEAYWQHGALVELLLLPLPLPLLLPLPAALSGRCHRNNAQWLRAQQIGDLLRCVLSCHPASLASALDHIR